MHFFHFAVHRILYSLLRWVNRCTPKQSSRSQGQGEKISCHGISPVCMVYWRSFLCMRVPRTLSWYIAQFCLISWLVANTSDKHECLSCSLDVASPPFACMQAIFFFSLSRLRRHPPSEVSHLQFGTNYFLWVTCLNNYIQVTYFDSFWQQWL